MNDRTQKMLGFQKSKAQHDYPPASVTDYKYQFDIYTNMLIFVMLTTRSDSDTGKNLQALSILLLIFSESATETNWAIIDTW
jgi:hypothetical protein